MLTVAAALASLGAIVLRTGCAKPTLQASATRFSLAGDADHRVVLGRSSTRSSRSTTRTNITASADGKNGGLDFPERRATPYYWDFVYFSFVIGMTSQVSDVGDHQQGDPPHGAAHGVVSFFFNAALLALTVNIAASAI